MSSSPIKNFSLKTILPRSLFGRSLLILIIPVLLIQMITSFMFFRPSLVKSDNALGVCCGW
jgi:hypothetical protein